MPKVHVIGAGLAGLSAALRLSNAGYAVELHEAAGHAGGRCRSLFDEKLQCEIDNGNHLLLSGNTAAARYLAEVGGDDAFFTAEKAVFPFLDMQTGRRWCLRPNHGPVPWWIFVPGRRVPDTHVSDYFTALRLRRAGPDDTVESLLGDREAMYQRFWRPLTVAVLNTPPERACARLLWPMLLDTFARGAKACRPRIARLGLSKGLVDPALQRLTERGARVRFGRRLRALTRAGGRVTELLFTDGTVALNEAAVVILAVPAAAAAELLPQLDAPRHYHPIANIHFRYDTVTIEEPVSFLGIIGGTAEWLFRRGDLISVTVSAADGLADRPAEAVAEAVWRDAAAAYGLPVSPLPPYRVVKERRATIAQTGETERLRPPTRTPLTNLFLAGDWTATGLPATIEGAIRSGESAAEAVQSSLPAC